MKFQKRNAALVKAEQEGRAAILNAAQLWASATTSQGARRDDLLRDKQKVVASFFEFIKKHPADVAPTDVRKWLGAL